MKFGFGLSMFGAVVSMIAMAYAWTGELDDMYPVGLNMLAALMFFASAGTFTKYTPVNGNTTLIISAMALAVVGIGALYESTLLWVSILLAAVAVCGILVAACPNTSRYIEDSRIV